MTHGLFTRAALAAVSLSAALSPLAAQASSALALDKGCYSCHGAVQRGEAPTFEQLASRLSKYRGDAAAEQGKVARFRAGEMGEHIDAHERLTPASAGTLLHWLVEGGAGSPRGTAP